MKGVPWPVAFVSFAPAGLEAVKNLCDEAPLGSWLYQMIEETHPKSTCVFSEYTFHFLQ